MEGSELSIFPWALVVLMMESKAVRLKTLYCLL